MTQSKIAYRYAKALFDYAVDEKILDEVYADMELVGMVCKQNRDFRIILRSPVINKKKKIAILREIFKDHLTPATMTYLQIITRKSRENYIPDIPIYFIELFYEEKNIKTAILKTAVPVDESLRKKVIALLEKKMQARIKLTEEVDPGLIGGFIIQVDDQQYDSSIQRKLKMLKREFEDNIYIREF
jgi:F-type H+-transporting ATPase subunit delta